MLINIISIFLLTLTAASSEEPIFVYSDEILENSQDCTVHQGDGLTLIACPEYYSLYHTNELAINTKSLSDYGETRVASAVSNSLAPNRDGHLTYLIDGTLVTTAWWDSYQSTAIKTTVA